MQISTSGVDNLAGKANTSEIYYKDGECFSKRKFRVLSDQVAWRPGLSCMGRRR